MPNIFKSLILAYALSACCAASGQTLLAVDYGVVADGVTDDGPAITAMLDAAKVITEPVILLFPSNQNIYVKNLPERYVFPFYGVTNYSLDGGGSTFLLDSYVRFLDLTNSHDVNIYRLKVDFLPLPFVDGLVVNKSPAEGWIEVDVPTGDVDRVLGTPTFEDGEQAFFSMLWNEGTYGRVSIHYWTTNTVLGSGPGKVKVYTNSDFNDFDSINTGVTQISIPVPGIAHRYGPGPCFAIENNKNVMMEDVELWSAPWFGFTILCNEGNLTFKRVNVRPKPASGRLLSVWRDGFHVKGNRSSLLWEDCVFTAMGDDAFNISTHSRRVKTILSPTNIIIEAKYPLNPIPWTINDIASAVDPDTLCLLGSSVVTRIEYLTYFPPQAPLLEIELDHPIPNLKVGDTIWQPISTNPDTILRRCNIEMSCRMQSPVTLDNCDITALLWFYGEEVEGAFPSNVKINNCRLRRGRGNAIYGVVFAGMPKTSSADNVPPRAIHDISLILNDIYGGFIMQGVENILMKGNRFLEIGAPTTISDNYNLNYENGDIIGKYTFNDTGAGTFEQRYEIAMAPTSVENGVGLSTLGTNTTTQLDFAGFNNVPGTAYDGYGFGGNYGDQVMFFYRAESGYESAWDKSDTSSAVQPLHFTVSADAGFMVRIESITVDPGQNGTPTIYAFQEAGTARGDDFVSSTGGVVNLNAPVNIETGTSKTFTIYLNSGNFNSTHQFDNIAVNGYVIPEPCLFIIFYLLSGNLIQRIKFRM